MPLGWAAPRRDGPSGPGIHTVLVTKAVEDPGGRKPRVPEAVPPARAPPPSDASFACTSKGVYENYRRWQRYKALARRHFPATPDAEALACFFIPVLRSLARLRPDMTLEDGVPRAIQEWEHSSNFERMIFYEMAEKFMEFEAEEEQQIQKMKLLAGCSQFQAPVPKPTKLTPSPATESGQQQEVSLQEPPAPPSPAAPPSTSTPGAPREIPAEAVHQYAEIMEGLETSWEEEEDEKKEPGGRRDPRDREDGLFPDPSLLQYIDQLCSDEEFVCKVEAVVHPQFIADLLSAERSQDPLDLVEELEEELNLTPSQLIQKRLLVLSEEERDPSICPTSHSDSTPSQSEEEDEASNSGKGKESSSEAIKRTSADNGIRTSQPEMPGPGTGFLLVPSSHQHVGKGDFPLKAGRISLSSSLCGSHGSQAERALPTLKNTDERETQNLQKQNPVGLNLGQAKGIPPHAQWDKISPITAENNSLTGNKSSPEDMTGQGVQRPRSTPCGRKDGGPGKVKGQDETQRAPEQVSHTVKAQSHEETQLVWQNLEPAHNACGKQDVQQGEVKHEQKFRAIWEGEEHTPKGISCANQNINKMLLGDHTSAEGALQNLNGHGERHFEKVTGQPQDQAIRGSEDTSSRTGLDNQGTGMESQRDNQTNRFSEQSIQLECKNQDGGQREVLRGHIPVLACRKGLNSALNAALPHCGSMVSCSKSLAGREHRTSVLAGSGKPPDGREAKVRLPKKPQIGWEKTKCTPVKIKSSSGKALRCCADNLAPSTSTEQDGRQPSCLPILETDQQVNCPVFTPSVELRGCKGNHLASTDSIEVRVLKGQLPRISTEHLSFSNRSGLLSPSLSIQKDAGNTEKFQKAQWPYTDQGEVTPRLGNQPVIRQILNPSDCIVAVEADEGNCGRSGDHTPVPSSSSKTAEVLSPRLSNCDENDEPNQRVECSNLLSSEGQSEGNSGSEVRNLGLIAETQDLLEPATEASATLLELSGGNVERDRKYGAKEEQAEEEDEEDEELSSFSSLLASKLSLSPHCSQMPCPKEQEDTVPSSPTENEKTVSKTRHSVRIQVPQEAIVLLSRNLGGHPTIHRSHKRKSNNLGTRRSKRLRNQ